MNESDIEWEKVGSTLYPQKETKLDNLDITFNLKFKVLKFKKGNDEYYQLNVNLPFSFKSSWIKTNHETYKGWEKYALERLEKKRYK